MDFEDRVKREIQTAQRDGIDASEIFELFESATPEQRVICFHWVLKAGVLDDEYAFEFLNTIRGDCDPTTPEGLASYTNLLDQLQEDNPKLFQQSSHYYHRDLINFAIFEGRWGDLSELLTPFTSGNHLDIFTMVIAQLRYHGQVKPLIKAMKIAWPKIKCSSQYLEWTSEEFAGTLMELMLVDYLESSSNPRPDDPELIELTAFLLPWKESWLDWFIPTIIQPDPSEWSIADLSTDVGYESWMHKFNTLLVEFIGAQWRVGVPLSRGLMAWHKWSEIFYAQSKESQKRENSSPHQVSHLLIPQSTTMDKILGESFSLMGGEPYEVAAALALIPAYLNFLEELGLIQSNEGQQAIKKIRPMVDQVPQIMEYYEGDPIAIEILQDAWAL